MHIDTCLGIVPAAATTVLESTCLGAAIICVFGIEDIVDLAQQTNIGCVIFLAPLLHRQLVLEVQVRGGIRTKHGVFIFGVI